MSLIQEVDKYKMLMARGSDKLTELVNKHLEEGYALFGNPVLSHSYMGLDDEGVPKMALYCGQAVVLPFDEEES